MALILPKKAPRRKMLHTSPRLGRTKVQNLYKSKSASLSRQMRQIKSDSRPAEIIKVATKVADILSSVHSSALRKRLMHKLKSLANECVLDIESYCDDGR